VKTHSSKSAIAYLIVVILSICLCVFVGARALRDYPPRVFRNLILDPMPGSVKRIKASQSRGINQHTYIVRFDIAEDDLLSLVRCGPFKEIQYVTYDRGLLIYGEDKQITSSVWLYEVPRGERQPAWFQLERWGSFRSYILEQERSDLYNARFLLYHESRGEAYFIEYEMRGKWGGSFGEESRRQR
jgi:hypothetical protein